MKKHIVPMLVVLSFHIAMACETNTFNIYYLPIDADFYIPTTREYIKQHGINFEMDSCELTSLFKTVTDQSGVEPQIEDYKVLRILIISKSDNSEIFITSDKQVISNDKKYNVDVKIVDNVLNEIVGFISSKKLGSP